jgi:hypothetical protein
VLAQPEEPPEDVRDVAAEHAAVGVQLVDDDDPYLLEQLEPLRVMRQDRRVEHVRVRDDDLAGGPDRGADRGRRVAVVCRRRDLQVAGPGESRELRHLILAEGLRREQEQGPRRGVLGQRLEDGQGVAECLAGRRRGDDHDVLAAVDRGDRVGLVRVERPNAALLEAPGDPLVEPWRKWRRPGFPCGQPRVMDDATCQ